jgi:hypothetical protein
MPVKSADIVIIIICHDKDDHCCHLHWPGPTNPAGKTQSVEADLMHWSQNGNCTLMKRYRGARPNKTEIPVARRSFVSDPPPSIKQLITKQN